jgi:MFS family permease
LALDSKLNKNIIASSTIGSIFEVFDFIVFALFSTIIADLFFPKYVSHMSLLFTYLTITMTYLLRPIGGVILGHLGDKYGRKTIFSVSILLMAIPSFIIGILPTYNQIGYLATFLLVITRFLQGISFGGEVPGSITFIAEKFKHKNYFYYCAWITFGANIGVSFASISIYFLLHYTTHDFLYSYGWRIPFLFGSLLAIVGFYIRRYLSETEAYMELQQAKKLSTMPLAILFKDFKLNIICAIMLAIVGSILTSIFHIFMPSLLTKYYNFNMATSTNVSAIGALTFAIFSLLFAYFTKFINYIQIIRMSLVSLLIAMLMLLMFNIDLNHISTTQLYFTVISISILLSGINGVMFGVLANIFPTQIRFSGIAISYAIATTIGAGIVPLWTSYILKLTNDYRYILIVCIGVILLALMNTILISKKNFQYVVFNQ